MPSRTRPRQHVAIGIIERRGRFLICRRRAGGDLGGYWEFPGGKRQPGETWEACLRRELREELGVTLRRIRPDGTLRYRYPHKTVSFKLYRCTLGPERPQPLSAEMLRWVTPSELSRFRFPPANAPLVKRLAGR